jgi:hypothetical protein
MTTHMVGQVQIALWCGVAQPTIAMWIKRYNDYPKPDVIVDTGINHTVRGWLPARQQDWEAYARIRAASPGAQIVAQRHDRQV